MAILLSLSCPDFFTEFRAGCLLEYRRCQILDISKKYNTISNIILDSGAPFSPVSEVTISGAV
jgi:hypothetical protein